jgi:hypothetical protein
VESAVYCSPAKVESKASNVSKSEGCVSKSLVVAVFPDLGTATDLLVLVQDYHQSPAK